MVTVVAAGEEEDSYAGGLVGKNVGSIEYCFAAGNVFGNHKVGGLTGQLETNGKIKNCYAAGNVNGLYELGGLVGKNKGSIESCYAVGEVAGHLFGTGGLVGVCDGGGILYSYWDKENNETRSIFRFSG